MSTVPQHPLEALLAALTEGSMQAQTVIEQALSNATHWQEKADLKAFIHLNSQGALQAAQALDARKKEGAGDLGPLAGIPIAIKDLIMVEGMPTTCGAEILGQSHVAAYNASIVERLLAAGAIVLGKTNLDAFGMGSANRHSLVGPCRNPWDLQRSPGGSSGGSAAAVATGITPVALGTDTGGSIRQPAAWTGTVGLKPSYGRVSRYGVVGYASSLDQAGVFGRSVRDVARIFAVIAGWDAKDATSVRWASDADRTKAPLGALAGEPTLDPIQHPNDFLALPKKLRDRGGRMRLGILPQALLQDLDPAIARHISQVAEHYAKLDVEIVPIDLAYAKHHVATYYILATAEASSNLARYDGIAYGRRAQKPADLEDLYRQSRSQGFGAEVRRRILLGTYVLADGYQEAYFGQAQKVRRCISEDYQQALGQVDAILSPVSPGLPELLSHTDADPMQAYLGDAFTVGANLAGLCGITVPCGIAQSPQSQKPLPVGFQLLGAPFAEATLLHLAERYACQHPFTERPPC